MGDLSVNDGKMHAWHFLGVLLIQAPDDEHSPVTRDMIWTALRGWGVPVEHVKTIIQDLPTVSYANEYHKQNDDVRKYLTPRTLRLIILARTLADMSTNFYQAVVLLNQYKKNA